MTNRATATQIANEHARASRPDLWQDVRNLPTSERNGLLSALRHVCSSTRAMCAVMDAQDVRLRELEDAARGTPEVKT